MEIKFNVDFDPKKLKPRTKYEGWLVITLVFQAFFFFLFQLLNKSYQTWDSAGHIGMSMLFADRFKGLLNGSVSILDVLRTSDYYPPFIQSLGAILNLIVSYSSEKTLIISLLFFALSLIYLYKLIFIITYDEKLAVVSAMLFSLFPQIYDQARVFLLDLPLITLLLMALYYFIESDGLRNRSNAIKFFIIFGLVQLTKWYGFIYLIVPISYVLLMSFLNQLPNTKIRKILLSSKGIEQNLENKTFWKERNKQSIINIAIGSLIVLVIASPWYIANYSKLIEYSRIFATPEIDDPQNLLSFENFLYYPQRVMTHQILLLPAILSLIGFLKVYKTNKKVSGLIFLAFIVPYFVFTFLIQNKNLRYVMPLTPLYAVFISYYLFSFKKEIVKKISFGIVFLYLLFAFFFLSFNQIKAQSFILKPIGVLLGGPFYNIYYDGPQFYSYESYYWPVKEVLNFIVEDANYPKDKGLGITPLFDQENFSLATFEMLRRESHLDNVYVPVPYFQFKPFDNDEDILAYFNDNYVDYVIVPANPGPSGLRNYDLLVQLIDYFGSYRNQTFIFIREFKLPDGNYLRVFKRNQPGVEIKVYDPFGDPSQPNSSFTTNTVQCKESAGKDDGIETIKLSPYHTYVFYTGHFGVNGFVKDYESGILYILKLENIPHTSNLDVYNLPHNGVSMCDFPNLNVDVSESIKKPLTEKGHCGIDCNEVVVVTWKVGEENFDIKEYNRNDFSLQEGIK